MDGRARACAGHQALAAQDRLAGEKWRRVRLRRGAKGPLRASFAAVRERAVDDFARRAIIFIRKPIISATLWMTWSGQRGSSMQRARRSATRSRFSTSARARTPLLDDRMPPSKRATTDLPRTDDKPVSGSVGTFTAGVVSGKWRGSA